MTNGMGTNRQEAMEAERAQLFALLGRLLAAAPDPALLQSLGALPPGATPLAASLGRLAEAAREAARAALEREFHDLFIGVGRGELLPYASYYLTGFLHERPLAVLRSDLARLGVARAPGIPEPEDHIAFVCETYAGLLAGVFPGGAEAAEAFFARHIGPWAARFFADLEGAAAARFYRPVGALGRLAVEIEQAASGLPA
jgi:TorA maturation chaperone TorD